MGIAQHYAWLFLVTGLAAFGSSAFLIWRLVKTGYSKTSLVGFLKSLTIRKFLLLGLEAAFIYVVFTTSVNVVFAALVVFLRLNFVWFLVLPKLFYVGICVVLWVFLERSGDSPAGKE